MVGPRYPDHWPLGPKRRAVVFFLAVMCLERGNTLFFPGRAVAVEHMSALMPCWATAVLLAAGMVAELITGHRLPPPVFERLRLMFAASRRPQIGAMMAAEPPARYLGEPAPAAAPAVRFAGARLRVGVLYACGLGLAVLLLVVWRAAAATLPAG